MTVQDNNFIIKNGLSVGTGKHQVLDSNGRITGNYFTLNAGGRYLSAGVDLWDLMSAQGIPPLSTNAWNSTHNSVLFTSGDWDSVYSFVNTDSATNNTDYNRTTFVNVTGDVMTGGLEMSGDLQVGADTYLEGHLRVDGKTYLSAEMYVENDAYVMGNFRADGDVWLAVEGVYPKSIYMGATNDDRVVFRADVDSNIIPDHTITYDLGTSEQQWRELFVHDISATNDVFIDNDLLVSANGTIGTDFRVSGDTVVGGYTELSGTLDVKDFTTLHDDLSVIGDMYVDGNVFLSAGNSGKIVLGTGNDDNVIFQADVDSNIIPDDDVTYDLGTNTQQWRELFVQDISATNDVFIDNDLLVSANGTIGTDFRVSGHTTVGGDTVLSGTLDVEERAWFHDDVWIMGDLRVDGNAWLSAGVNGVVYVGDTNTDNVVFRADVDSNIIPDDDVTYDLGTSSQQWRELFVQDISATNDVFVDNDLLVSANGTIGTDFRVSGATVVGGYTELSGTLDVKDFTTLHDDLSVIGDMYVDGSVFLSAGNSGKIVLGTDNTDNVIFHADVDSNIIPDDDVTFDLGTSEQQWRELFVQDISATNDVFVDNDLLVSANGTIGTDFRVSGATVVGGYTELSGTLDVKDFTTLHDDLSVIGDMYVDGNVFLSGGQSGDIYLGTSDDDNVIFNADVNSDIIPESALTFDLGTDDKHWNTLYVHDVSASNNIRVSNTLYTDTIRTDDTNFLHIAAGMDDTAGSFIRLFNDNRMFLHADQFNFGDVFESIDSYRPWVLQIFTDTQHINMDSTLNVVDDATFNSDVWIKGDLRVDGNAWLSAGVNGVVYVGDTNTDNVVFRADVDSNIIPDDDVTFDLGTSTQQWRELFVQDISATNDVFVDNDLLVSANGTIGTDFRVSGHTTVGGDTVLSGTLDVDDATYIYDTLDVELKTTLHNDLLVSGNTHIVGDLRVDGNAWLSAGVDGVINVGDTNTDNVVFHADIDSGLTPNKDVTFDLGTNTQQWRELFVQDISATNDVFVNNDLLVSANGTIGTDFRVSGHTTVGGDTVLSGTLDVDDATYVHDTLDVELDTRLHDDLFVTGNTTVSGNTVLSGTLDVQDFVTFYDDLSVRGDLYVDGNAYLSAGADGNIYVGDTDGDNVVFRADINSDIIPEQHHTFDIGTDDKHWNTLFVNDISANGDVKINQTLFVDQIRPDLETRNTVDINAGTINLQSGDSITDGSGMAITSGQIRFNSDRIIFGDIRETADGWRPWVLDMDVDAQTAILSATLTGKLDATFEQNLTVLGDTTLGNSNTDNVVFVADIDSNIIPDDDVTYDLGTNTQQWRELFVHDISATNDVFVDNDLLVSANGTIGTDFRVSGHTTVGGDTVLSGALDVDGFTTLHGSLSTLGDVTTVGNTTLSGMLTVAQDISALADLYVDGNVWFKGDGDGTINLGDSDTDSVVFVADVSSNIIPDADVTYDLGTNTKQWRELYVQDVSATRDIFVDNDLLVSANGTIGTDFRVSGHTTVGGDTVLSGTLGVDDATYVHDTLDVELDTHLHSDLFVTNNTTISGNTVLSGTFDVQDFVTFYDDLSVKGDLYVDGNAYLSAGTDGNIYVGDTDSDNVVFRADINSDLIPEQHHTFDIGTDDKHWNTLFVNDISANGDVKINQTLFVDTIQPDATGIVKIAAGSDDFSGAFVNVQSTSINFHADNFLFGDIRETTDNFRPWILNLDTDNQTTTLDSTLTVTKDATFRQNVTIDGNLIIGNNDSDSVNFNADVISNITPNTDVTYDLGTSTKQWRELFVQDISASGDIFVDNNLSVSGDFAADGNTILGGDVEIQNDLTVSGHVSAVSGMTLTGDLTANDDVYIKGSIVVEGHAYFGYGIGSNQIHLGDPNVDEIIIQAEIGSDIIPYPSGTFDLGTLSKKWRKLYVEDIHSSGNIETMNNISLSGSLVHSKNIAVDEHLQTREDIWRVQSGRPWNETFDVETFDSTKYQSVQYTVMAISDANITTVNATFVCDGTSINGTVYGTTNIGTVDPIVDLDVVNLNGKYTVKITLSPYAKAMITGKAMFLQ